MYRDIKHELFLDSIKIKFFLNTEMMSDVYDPK